jgi:hypothetical protein
MVLHPPFETAGSTSSSLKTRGGPPTSWESPFASVRLRTTAAKRFRRVDSATILISKLLTVAEKRLRKLNAPHLRRQVGDGHVFTDGKPVYTAHARAVA